MILYSFIFYDYLVSFQFFKPLNPVNVFVHVQPDGRASGEADVDFATHDEAKEAMSKDRATMRKFCKVLRQKRLKVGTWTHDCMKNEKNNVIV